MYMADPPTEGGPTPHLGWGAHELIATIDREPQLTGSQHRLIATMDP